jgi:hypothetical protein
MVAVLKSSSVAASEPKRREMVFRVSFSSATNKKATRVETRLD